MKELNFYVTDAERINRKYGGKHIAIVDDNVVASGNDPRIVLEKAIKKCPGKRPVLVYVPKAATVLFKTNSCSS